MSAQPTKVLAPEIAVAIERLIEASKAINELPDVGHVWEAKLAIAKAVDELVRARGGLP